MNTDELVPLAIAPLKWTMPRRFSTCALLVPNGALVQPFSSASEVNPAGDGANEAPSSEMKHCALAKNLAGYAPTRTTPPVVRSSE